MTTLDEAQLDEMKDVPAEFHEVVRLHGRGLWALVMNAQMAAQAAGVLAELVGKHRSKGGMHAVSVLANAFNQTSNELCTARGWGQEQIAACDRDCQLAFAGRLTVPEEKKIVLLN